MQDPDEPNDLPLAAWFLGPKAEHADNWQGILHRIFQDYVYWRRNYFPEDQIILDRHERREHDRWFDSLNTEIDQLLNHMKADYPFHSPRYIAHMLSEQTLPSVVGYFAGMLYNPNNVTDEVAPITVKLELEAGRMIASMLGYDPDRSWAHITSGGTIANLEALWVARTAQFVPLILRDYCVQHKLAFPIELPGGKTRDIRRVPKLALMQVQPDTAISLPRQLLHFLNRHRPKRANASQELNEHIQNNRYNITRKGSSRLYSELNAEPLVFVSEAAHYSIKKICGILGIGEEAVRPVPVLSNFRLDTKQLKKMLWSLKPGQVPLAVVGIVGTTEEGAIDPIHEILELRSAYEREKQRSFWLHLDAAWGGYIRSILNDPAIRDLHTGNLQTIYDTYTTACDISEDVQYFGAEKKVSWKDPGLFRSLYRMKDADSITVDPHKLGYVPYPSGAISFRNGLVTELISQKAEYILDETGGTPAYGKPLQISAVGPFIIEGSKPGAAAASTWLSHKTIPLDNSGHGKIIRTTLLNTKRLHFYLEEHRNHFHTLEKEVSGRKAASRYGFSFLPLFEPDSSLLCFLAIPGTYTKKGFRPATLSLARLNQLNKRIYQRLSIHNSGDKHKMPYGQEFFLSRTRFTHDRYAYSSIRTLLRSLHIDKKEFEQEGLFVLRSTIMNPWYHAAAQKGQDYLLEFVRYLHRVTGECLAEMKH